MMTFPMALAKQAKFKYLEQTAVLKTRLLPALLPEELGRKVFSFNKELCDFEITFCVPSNWYYGNGTITANQFDFRAIAAKKITNALGFNSNYDNFSLARYVSMDPKIQYLTYMSPLDSLTYGSYSRRPIQARNETSVEVKRSLSSMLKMYQYTGLYGTNFYNLDSINPIQRYMFGYIRQQISGYSDWRVELDGLPFLYFSTEGKRLLRSDYRNTSEFLMTRDVFKGETLASLMNSHNNGKLYGPRTLRVLEEIGHATPRKPIPLELYGSSKKDAGFAEKKRVSPVLASLRLKMGL